MAEGFGVKFGGSPDCVRCQPFLKLGDFEARPKPSCASVYSSATCRYQWSALLRLLESSNKKTSLKCLVQCLALSKDSINSSYC